ncbi:MAG: HlyC/CorC family transporter [Deltaproteobacteria bacterium]|nr:MAG: HlyC/CorC family transporter [Deltaproteobacteria bacterium]
MALLVLAVSLCLLLEALFTGAEMALVSADRNRLQDRARRGERGAERALALLDRPDRVLATTLTATNIFVVLSSVIVTSRLLPGFGEHAEWVAVLVVTPLVIVFGEVVPKSYVRPRADRLVDRAARLVAFAETALSPLVAGVSFLARTISAPFGGVPPMRALVTREDLELLLQGSRDASDVEAHERVMVRRVFHFGEARVADVFRPLPQVAALPEGASCGEAALAAARSGYSRYPVYSGRLDHILGYLHVLDIAGSPPDASILPFLRKALFVPELMPLDELLRSFREARTSFAVVVDEFGGVTGVVTAEDVVEEVVGEIEDEYDRGMEYYTKVSEDEFVIPGRMEVERLAEEFGVRLAEGDYTTVGGFLTSLAGRIPAAGETFAVPGAVLRAETVSERAVLEVRVRRVAEEAGEPEPGPGGKE